MKSETIGVAAVLALSATLLAPVAARAQDTEEPEHWSAEIGLGLNSSGGNQALTVITTSAGISHLEKDRYELELAARFRYGRSEGEDVAQNFRGTASLDFQPRARWSPFLFAAMEQDPFRKLDLRLNGGGGVKHTFWQEDWNEVSLSGAVLYSFENVALGPESTLETGITQHARWSWRGRVRRQVGDGNRFEQLVFYQPAWNYVKDYLLESQTALRVTLTQSLAATSTLLYSRDSTPAEDVRPDDWSASVGLSMATTW